ncbi:MAG: MarR family transcriptional regulator [Solirubrobacterales bacterium]|nr:MarR family transcriptional regulator [Solirubrobacterales bacterium]
MPELARLVSWVERRLTEQLACVLAQEGVTVEQWRTLALLADGAGHTMSEIAEFAVVPAASLTRLIDRMAADNLLYRRPDVLDRRRVRVRISRRGHAVHRKLAKRLECEVATADPDDLAGLLATLTRLIERLG